MIGQAISHNRITEKLGEAGWVSSIKPKTSASIGRSL